MRVNEKEGKSGGSSCRNPWGTGRNHQRTVNILPVQPVFPCVSLLVIHSLTPFLTLRPSFPHSSVVPHTISFTYTSYRSFLTPHTLSTCFPFPLVSLPMPSLSSLFQLFIYSYFLLICYLYDSPPKVIPFPSNLWHETSREEQEGNDVDFTDWTKWHETEHRETDW